MTGQMLRQWLIVLVLAVLCGPWVVGLGFAISPSDQISQLEQQFFARTYPQDTVTDRLDRLETIVYGSPQSNQSLDQRMHSLEGFFQTKPTDSLPMQKTATVSPKPLPPAVHPSESVAPGESDYPAVTAMEEKVFQQHYTNEPIDNRLARLEQKVLGLAQQGTLQQRTDQLRMMILGDANADSGYPNASQGYNATPISQSSPDQGGYSGQPVAASQQMIAALPDVEHRVLKQAYPQDPVEVRLNRLEMAVFNETAPELSPDERLYRIAGVVNAKQSARQENAMTGGNSYGMSPAYRGSASSSSYATLGTFLLMMLMSLL